MNNRLGSGSDYTCPNFLGVSVIDMSFDGPYGVYHSQYDNHQWVARIGDPGFRYHEAMTKLWGVMALRSPTPTRCRWIPAVRDTHRRVRARGREEMGRPRRQDRRRGARVCVADGRSSRAAASADKAFAEQSRALAAGDRAALPPSTPALQAERALLDPAGIPRRPWYRHQIYAPKFTYAPE